MNLLESDDLGPQKIEEKFLPFREEKGGEGGIFRLAPAMQ